MNTAKDRRAWLDIFRIKHRGRVVNRPEVIFSLAPGDFCREGSENWQSKYMVVAADFDVSLFRSLCGTDMKIYSVRGWVSPEIVFVGQYHMYTKKYDDLDTFCLQNISFIFY